MTADQPNPVPQPRRDDWVRPVYVRIGRLRPYQIGDVRVGRTWEETARNLADLLRATASEIDETLLNGKRENP